MDNKYTLVLREAGYKVVKRKGLRGDEDCVGVEGLEGVADLMKLSELMQKQAKYEGMAALESQKGGGHIAVFYDAPWPSIETESADEDSAYEEGGRLAAGLLSLIAGKLKRELEGQMPEKDDGVASHVSVPIGTAKILIVTLAAVEDLMKL